jgi:neutral ceramidase
MNSLGEKETMIHAASVQIDITPPIGVKMAGYGARTEASQGIHDPLKAQVLQIKSEDSSALIITMDLLGVQKQFSDKLRASVSKETGIPESQIMLSCSHTHSGPQGFNLDDKVLGEDPDENLREITFRKIVGACRWVSMLLQPAKLSLGYSNGSGVGLNRNDPLKGSADQQVIVLRIDDLNGKPIAVLYNYGCHPTVMGASNLLISADYPGAVRKAVNGIFPDTVIHFTNGSAGDVSTRFTRRSATFEEVERIGQIMAGAVLQAMNTTETFDVDTIKGRMESVDLPLKSFPSVEEANKLIQTLKNELVQMQKSNAPAGEIRKIVTKTEGAEILLLQIKQFEGKEKLQASLQQIQIGPLSLIGVPGEPFSKTFLDIKEQTSPRKVILLGYANDYKGYFPESAPGLPSTYENYVSPYSSQAALNIKEKVLKMIMESSI